jgi:hypothetical protein
MHMLQYKFLPHTAVEAGKQFLRDLAERNSKMAARLSSATYQFFLNTEMEFLKGIFSRGFWA